MLVNLLTRGARLPIYQALPMFVLHSIFEATVHVLVVVSPLVSSIKDQVDKLGNLGILVASLVISVKEMQRVSNKEMFEVKPARGDRP